MAQAGLIWLWQDAGGGPPPPPPPPPQATGGWIDPPGWRRRPRPKDEEDEQPSVEVITGVVEPSGEVVVLPDHSDAIAALDRKIQESSRAAAGLKDQVTATERSIRFRRRLLDDDEWLMLN